MNSSQIFCINMFNCQNVFVGFDAKCLPIENITLTITSNKSYGHNIKVKQFLFDLILYVPVNNLSVMSGLVFLG